MKFIRFSQNKKVLFITILSVIFIAGCEVSRSTETRFTIKGTEIYDSSLSGDQKLFTNVTNVSEVRLGPDEKTIHFKVIPGTTTQDYLYQPYCADLKSVVEPITHSSASDPPIKAPWDYQRIAHAYTINGCGYLGLSGGYLKDSDYFVYIELQGTTTAKIVLENIAKKKVNTIPIDAGIVTPYLTNMTDYSSLYGIQGKNGSMYFYPQRDAFLLNNKMLLAFGALFIDVDLTTNKLIGTPWLNELNNRFTDYRVIADIFWFEYKKNLPYVAIKTAWESPPYIVALLDLSGNTLKTVPSLDKGEICPFDYKRVHPLEWNDASLTLNFCKVNDITDQVSKQDLDFFTLPNNTTEEMYEEIYKAWDRKNQEIENRLFATGKYIDVLCNLPPGMRGSFCNAITEKTSYQIRPGTELLELR